MKAHYAEVSAEETNRASEAADNFIACCRAVMETAPPPTGQTPDAEQIGFALGSIIVQATILAHVRSGACAVRSPDGDASKEQWIPPADLGYVLAGMAHAVGFGCGGTDDRKANRRALWLCEQAMTRGLDDARKHLSK
jgi:hypothetical protein